ncbi:MAG TPA: phosphoribosyltransferase family protein [Candidatus Limnocylindria bacterium]|nr:phosphoribosyltransferase family protein [Candidatus Limnocylindria bacterium]
MDTFRDRADAGRRLADLLGSYAEDRPIVLGLPRGGVVTAAEIARALHAPLDVLVVRKLGAPAEPEFGVGAIAPGEVRIVDRASMRIAGMDEDDLRRVTRDETAELERRERRYRGGRAPLDVRGRTVILVDDGIATGVTARAAISATRRAGATRIILAVGVCAPDTAEALRAEVDDLVCVLVPEELAAVSLYFDDFRPVDDDDVVAALALGSVAVPV